jgi:hypothetical protein
MVCAYALALGRTPDVVGKIISSSHATVEGSALLASGTILSGDAVEVGEGGSVLLSFSPTGRAVLAPATHVRFRSASGNIEAQLLGGSLSVERQNKDSFVVATATHRFQPLGEGKAEFRIALVPDKGTLIETRQGQLAITDTASGERYTLAEGLLAQIPTAAHGQDQQPANTIGKVVAAVAATRNGAPLSPDQFISNDDLISTGPAGRLVVQLSLTSQITLQEGSAGHLSRMVERVWLRLEKGKAAAESKGEGSALIATSKYYIEPASPGPSQVFVWVLLDNSTYVEAVIGDVRIEELKSERSYILPAGQNTMIPVDASGIPGLQPMPAPGAPAPTPAPAAAPPPPTPAANPSTAKVSKPHSHTAIIILGVAGGAGAAVAIAVAEGGKSNGNASPSAP